MANRAGSGGDETLEGVLERIVFRNEDSRFTVARLRVEGRSEPVTVVGDLLGAAVGAPLRLRGRWAVDPRYGEQFRAEGCQTVTPATAAGIERFLGSGLVPGIGPELAARIVQRFGARTIEIIDTAPERLVEVQGIGRLRAERIRTGFRAHRDLQDVMVYLQGLGIPTGQALRIWRRYGASAPAVVRENPYRLALDVWGIGFRTADEIARGLGIDRAAPARIEAGLLHVLGALVEEGHVHAPEPQVIAAARAALEVDDDLIEAAIGRTVAAGRVVKEELGDRGPCLSLHAMWEAETRAAAGLARIAGAPVPAGARVPDVSAALAAFERERGLVLADRQREAVAAAHDRLVVITGGPGVGKTTIVNAVIRVLEAAGRRVLLGAPTGRAAKRLSEATGRPAATLHRMLEFSPRTGRFERDEARPLEAQVIIVDEASMLDVPLTAALVAAVPPGAQLFLVGDVDQLPSVGPGRVLADVIESGAARVVRLTEIFRQAQASAIVRNAHRINRGALPETPAGEGTDFFFIERAEPADVRTTIEGLLAERIPRRFGLDALDDVQVLTPMHRGEVGARNLNATLQARLNPPRPGVAELTRGSRTFRVGDKVMQIRNDYDRDVFNGDLGRVVEIAGDAGSEQVVVEIDGRRVAYEGADLDELVHAFAMSVHKSQGSEYPAVVMPLVTQHYLLLRRNLLYTAVTRGKRLVVLVGTRKALGIAVRTDDTRERWTWLAARVRAARAPQK